MISPRHTVRLRNAVSPPTVWLAVATIALALAAAGFASLLWGTVGGESRALVVAAGLAGATIVAPSWWLAITRSGSPGVLRGAFVGLLTGVLAHVPFWAYGLALKAAFAGRFADVGPGFGIGALFGATFGLFGVVVLGPVTGVVGAVTGGVVGGVARLSTAAGEE